MNAIINEALISTKHIQYAAIIRKKDGIVKAKTLGFTLTPHDVERIAHAFESIFSFSTFPRPKRD